MTVALATALALTGCASTKGGSAAKPGFVSSVAGVFDDLFHGPYDSVLLRAEQLARAGKTQDAAALFEKTIPRIPADQNQDRARAFVELGDCQAELGKLREAYGNYQNAWEADSQNLEAHLRLAQFLANGDQNIQAAEHADFVLKRRPDDATALGILGGVEEAAGHDTQAELLLRRSLAIDPQKPPVAITLAQAYARENKLGDARKVLTEAATITADPKQAAMAWLALGRLEEQEGKKEDAEAAYRAAVKADDAVLTNFRLAQFLQRSAKISEAEQVLQRVDAIRPGEPSSVAESRLNAGRMKDALAVMRLNSPQSVARAIEGGIHDGRSIGGPEQSLQQYANVLDAGAVTVLHAELELAEGNISKAEASAKLAVQRSQNSAAAHYVRGLVFEQQDKIAEAKEQWDAALQLDADYVPAQIVLARQNLAEGDLKTAEAHISSVVRDEPANFEALCIFARILLREGRSAPAAMIAARAEVVNPTAAEAHAVMGDVAMQEKRFGVAFMEFERALLLEPESPEALSGVLEVYRHGTITSASLRKMERVAKSPPSSAPLLEVTGRLYAAKGMYAEAQRTLRESLALDPKRPTAAVALAEASYANGDREPEQLLADMENTLHAGRGMARTLQTLQAAQAEKHGDDQAAVREYEAAISAGESSGLAANNLAWEYAQQGVKLDRALQLALEAVDRDPKNPAALDTLGFVETKMHDYTRAVFSLDRAVALMSAAQWHKQRAEVYRHLAEACAGAGLLERATEARSKADEIERRYNR